MNKSEHKNLISALCIYRRARVAGAKDGISSGGKVYLVRFAGLVTRAECCALQTKVIQMCASICAQWRAHLQKVCT